MENKRPLTELIQEATTAIEASPEQTGLYITRAKLHYRAADYGNALNDVLKALELDPQNGEARAFEKIIRDIFDYRYTEYYNP